MVGNEYGDDLEANVGGQIDGASNVVGSKGFTSQSAVGSASVAGQDQISAEVGNDGKNIVIGKDIRQTVKETNTGGGSAIIQEPTATGNVVNVTLPSTWNPSFAHGQDTLSVSAEQRLSEDIRELRTTITRLAETVSSLDKTLAIKVQSVKDRVSTIETLFEQMLKERDVGRPIFDKRVSNMLIVIGVMILVLLGIIAWSALVRNNVASSATSAVVFALGGIL